MSNGVTPVKYPMPTGSSFAYRGDNLVGWYCNSCDTLYSLDVTVCEKCAEVNKQSTKHLLLEETDD